MRTFLKIVGRLLFALAALIGGLCLFSWTPIVHEVEIIPLENLPPHVLTAKRVADLNERLKESTSSVWKVAPLMLVFNQEAMLAVPTEAGGLQLVHVYPALASRVDSPGKNRQTVVQQWLAHGEKEERGE